MGDDRNTAEKVGVEFSASDGIVESIVSFGVSGVAACDCCEDCGDCEADGEGFLVLLDLI